MNSREKKRNTLFILWGLDFLQAMVDVFPKEGSPLQAFIYIVFLIVEIVALMRWFFLDAKEHNYEISRPLFTMLVAVTVVAAPFYFFRTRGKGAFLQMLKAIGFFMVGIFCAALGYGLGTVVKHFVV